MVIAIVWACTAMGVARQLASASVTAPYSAVIWLLMAPSSFSLIALIASCPSCNRLLRQKHDHLVDFIRSPFEEMVLDLKIYSEITRIQQIAMTIQYHDLRRKTEGLMVDLNGCFIDAGYLAGLVCDNLRRKRLVGKCQGWPPHRYESHGKHEGRDQGRSETSRDIRMRTPKTSGSTFTFLFISYPIIVRLLGRA